MTRPFNLEINYRVTGSLNYSTGHPSYGIMGIISRIASNTTVVGPVKDVTKLRRLLITVEDETI